MRYEDLAVWKRSTRLSIEIYQHLRELKDFGFKDQVTRSGLSVPSNIAEGFDRESNKECVTFLSYAKGSCAELRTQIYIGIEIGYIERMTGERWIQETQEISLMLGGLIKTKRSFLKSGTREKQVRGTINQVRGTRRKTGTR
jgi:four helix bundle protein